MIFLNSNQCRYFLGSSATAFLKKTKQNLKCFTNLTKCYHFSFFKEHNNEIKLDEIQLSKLAKEQEITTEGF